MTRIWHRAIVAALFISSAAPAAEMKTEGTRACEHAADRGVDVVAHADGQEY